MKLSASQDVRSWLSTAASSPNQVLHPLIGSAGYELPVLESLTLIRTADCEIPGIAIGRKDEAPDNWLLLDQAYRLTNQFYICFDPGVKNNIFIVGRNTLTIGDYHIHGSGNCIILGENDIQYTALYLQAYSNDQLLFWGKNSTSNGTHIQILGDNRKIIVGEDCMFSSGIYLRNSDIHSLVDRKTGEHKNPPSDVLIEPHVWVGQDAYIGRKARIGFGSVIGTKSVVTRAIPRNCVAAGSPAKEVSTDTTWDRLPEPSLETLGRLAELEKRLR